MLLFTPRQVLLALGLTATTTLAHGAAVKDASAMANAMAEEKATPITALSLEDLNARIQQCPIVQQLNAELDSSAHSSHSSSDGTTTTSRLFAVLFPSTPAINAILATLYISGPPNFLLALCPPSIDPGSLSVMVAFAVGGLMGDTLFHLLPEIFLGEHGAGDEHHAQFVLVEPNRNLLLGAAILVGFMCFVGMDKALRIATGGAGHGHGHSHGHDRDHDHDHGHGQALNGPSEGKSSAMQVASNDSTSTTTTQNRKPTQTKDDTTTMVGLSSQDSPSHNPSVKLAGYLNMLADFTHNITDGLAMAASFYASPTVGATTTLAIFCHEIPHEVGDFALLIQSGFSKRKAMAAQFVTAVGAMLGTLGGIALQEWGGKGGAEADVGMRGGLAGTSLRWGDLLLPFTAGTFLYVGTVAVIPELLETGPNKPAEVRKTFVQFAAVALGAGIMLVISWH